MSRFVVLILLAVAGSGLPLAAGQAHQTAYSRQVQPCVAHHPPAARLRLKDVDATLIFSPQGGGEELIVHAIDAAQKTS